MATNVAVEEKPAGKTRPQWQIGLIISAVTIILCLGLLELVGYLWERSTAQGPLGWTLVASRRIDFRVGGSEDQPYFIFEPNRDYNWEGIPVHINSRGLRTTEVEIPKPAGTTRILNLGDSIAFGWEVREEMTYGRVLEGLLADAGQPVEVVNAGVPTWNLESERNFLLQEGLDYDPDLIVLDLTLVNDIFGGGPETTQQQSGLLPWLRDHTHGWPFLTTQMRFLLARQVGPEAIPVLNPPTEARAYYPLDEEHAKWDEIWGYIEEMAAAAAQRDIPMILIAFPTAFQLNSSAHPPVPQEVLSARAEAAGIPFIDLLPIYAAECAAAPAGACEGYENHLFADVWMHPNDLGHALAAEALLEAVQEALP